MPVVDGLAAAALMRSWTTCEPGYCLKYVWNAYAAQGAVSDATYPTAMSAWNAAVEKHPGDRNPPAGFPVYWGERPGSAAGDVVIILGGGQVVATDWPRNGVIGVTTLDQRQAQIGRPYLGWAGDILHNPIEGEDSMNKQDVKDALWEFYRDVTAPPPGMDRWPFFDLAVWQNPIPAQTPDGLPLLDPATGALVTFAAGGYLASTSANLQHLQVPPVDYGQLAKAMAAEGITVLYLEPESGRLTRGS